MVPPPAVVSTPVRPRVPVLEPRTEVEEEEMEEQAEEELVEKIQPTCVPASSNSRQTNMEVSYIDRNRGVLV